MATEAASQLGIDVKLVKKWREQSAENPKAFFQEILKADCIEKSLEACSIIYIIIQVLKEQFPNS
jgi:hypothetical protein